MLKRSCQLRVGSSQPGFALRVCRAVSPPTATIQLCRAYTRYGGAYGGASLRPFLDKVLRDGKAQWRSDTDGPRFIEALLQYDDPAVMLFRLTNQKELGPQRLGASLSCSDSPSFITGKLVPFLDRLACDDLCRGTYEQPLAQLLDTMYQVPGLLQCLQTALEQRQVPDATSIGWFVLNVAKQVDGARKDPAVQQLMVPLLEHGGVAKTAAKQLQVMLAGATAGRDGIGSPGSDSSETSGGGLVKVGDLQIMAELTEAGGRHGNDHADFRDIQIMVTSEEALSSHRPFLPRAADAHLQLAAASPEAALLDRHFRLLREDMLGPLRQELKEMGLVQPAGQQAASQAGLAVSDMAAVAIAAPAAPVIPSLPAGASNRRNVYTRLAVLGTAVKPRPCIMVSITLPNSHPAARIASDTKRKEFWQSQGYSTLPLDALVCLLRPDQPLLFATVVRREVDELAQQRPVVGLEFQAGSDVEWVLQQIGYSGLPNTALLQVSSNLLSSRPVLQCLQSMYDVPLSEELVHGQPQHIDYLTPEAVQEELERLQPQLDPSQQAALQQALSQRVALIQGPPGTGKTYTGVQICDAILRRSSETILCVCYTNHALDQFLEALLDKGITKIVRIGGRSKSERLQQYNLHALARNQGQNNLPLTQHLRRRQINEQLEQCEKGVSKLTARLAAVTTSSSPSHDSWRREQLRQEQPQKLKKLSKKQQLQRASDLDEMQQAFEQEWSSAVGQYLLKHQQQVWEQLQLPAGVSASSGYMFARWLRGDNRDSVQKKLKRKLPVAEPLPSTAAAAAGGEDIWQLPVRKRMQLADSWREELRSHWSENLAAALQRADKLQLELYSIYDGQSEGLLARARVIGCTTTGAAKYKSLLTGSSVAPRVVMIEEAGEILEAHTLTSLSSNTKHLIMIGDHKQLRPKIEHYPLSVQAGMGYSLNVSLFERLVLAGFPHASLAVQHRMLPEISGLIRHTYPSLQDHESVSGHPPIRGLGSRRLVFLDHNQPELQPEPGKGWWRQQAEFQSKVNPWEVHMAVAVLRFLLQQGYQPEQVVLLTPYLGQLLELQKVLSQEFEVVLNEQDLGELRSAVLPQAWAGVLGRSKSSSSTAGSGSRGLPTAVRVATIDNFQGEEADVVVASLVRCNDRGSTGFVGEPERLNVLQSRARHGLILIGSSCTFRSATSKSRNLAIMLDQLEQAGAVMPAFPAVCQQHGNVITPALDSPRAFLERSPYGGCTLPCTATLSCGHTCSLSCHAFDHSAVLCTELVYGECEQGHLTARQCGKLEVACQTCVAIRQVQEKAAASRRALENEAAIKRAEADMQKAARQAKILELQQQLAAMEQQAAARRQAVELELEGKKLEKEVSRQKEYGAAEVASWEAEQRQQAKQDLQHMEAEWQAEKEAAEQEAAFLQQQQEAAQAEQQQLQAAMAAEQQRLQQLEQESSMQLQQIENQKLQLEVAAADTVGDLGSSAQERKATYITASKWKMAAHAAAAKGPADDIETFRKLLQAASQQVEGSAGGSALDVAFDVPGIGTHLITYAEASDSPPLSASGSMQRGMTLIKDANWFDALSFFSAMVPAAPASTSPSDAAISAPSGFAAAADAAYPGSTSNSSSTPSSLSDVTVEASAFAVLCCAKLGVPPLPDAVAALSNAQASGPRGVVFQHPAQHLAYALICASNQLPPSLVPTPTPVSSSFSLPGIKRRSRPPGSGSAAVPRKPGAAAVGHALAFLLHPLAASGQLPQLLTDEAWQVLRSKAPSLLQVAPPGAAATPAAAAAAKQRELEGRAAGSSALMEMMKLTGLETVKTEMLNLADEVQLNKERDFDLHSKNYHVCFYGNPGTGKTTVACLYVQQLQELGILPDRAAFEETSGAALVSGGLTEIKDKLKKLEGGGVLFIDEAYQLEPENNPMGKQVLDYLLPEMENRRGKLVVVLAGYQKPMEEKIMSYNEGMPSRFPLKFKFPDYTDEQLLDILMGQFTASKGPVLYLEDEKYARIAARRLGRQRDSGAPGFGNARAVRNLREAAISRQSARVLKERRDGLSPDILLLKHDDLLGPKELNVSGSKPLQQLEGLRGLASVKKSVRTLLGLIRTNAELEEMERPLKDVCLNRVFLGNPGTGKTTVAGIYGRILHDLGLLSKGDVLVKVPADFIGSVLGESEKKTMAILEEARGCVLVIDEAYGLYSGSKAKDPYKEAVIDTIVAKVQGVPGDDRCVLLLGYPDQMEQMMREANPGLARRFQLAQAWSFEDYGKEDLLAIMKAAARNRYGWVLGWPELSAALSTLDQERRRPNFGNAGAVNNLLSAAAMRMEARISHLPSEERVDAAPAPEDFMSEADAAAAAAKAAGQSDGTERVFADLIGCKAVLAKLREWQATISASQALGKDPLDSFELNFSFVGAPGTGKTTVARRVGMLFRQLGLLATDGVVECSAGDFVTGFANQASGKTREMFEKALGGVLFIDEAYRLNPKHGGPYMSEVLDEICQILTDRKFMGKMVVVLAGYQQQVEELLAVNPGLKSRFSEKLVFPDFTVEDALQLLRLQLDKQYGLELSKEAEQQLRGLMGQLVAAPGWSNGRDVGTWTKRIFRAYSLRLADGSKAEGGNSLQVHGQPITPADLVASLTDLLASKALPEQPEQPGTAELGNMWEGHNLAPAFARQDAPAPPATRVSTATATATSPAAAAQEEEAALAEPEKDTAGSTGGFGGLDEQFLRDMQSGLESLGFDLTSSSIMQQLADDPALAGKLAPLLGGSSAVVTERVRQWQQAMQQILEQERELAKKKQRPVWRCAVCGRYGCPVAPYIERYEEF